MVHQKSKELTPISSFLETDSFASVKKKCENFIINRVDDFLIKRKYFYPNNVKLNIKKINIKRVIPMNVKNTQITNENDDSEKCNIILFFFIIFLYQQTFNNFKIYF